MPGIFIMEVNMKKWESWDCHDCEVKEGEIHQDGCDMERCPNCMGQLISCDCNNDDIKGLPAIPYILAPNLCGLCGQQWPDMFMVPDSEWKKYIIPALQDKILCKECYEELKKMFPNGWRNIT